MDEEEDRKIRSRSGVLNIYIKAMEAWLARLKTIEDSLVGWDAGLVLSARLEELEKDHQNLKDRFNAFSGTSEMLLLLKREYEFLQERSRDLFIEFSVSRDDIDADIEGLQEDMVSISIEEDHCGKKEEEEDRLIDLINECGESDEDREAVKALNDRAGAQLSRLLVDLMITASESDQAVETFRVFRSSLEAVDEAYENPTIAISKFVHLLKVAERQLKNRKIWKERLIGKNRVEELLDKFLSEIFNLELILKDRGEDGVPDVKILKDQALCFLEARFKQYEEDLKAAEKEVIHGSKSIDQSLKNAMELQINELWTQLEKPKEEDEEPDL